MSTVLSSYPLSLTTRLEIAQGDLTQESLDAIVNAANQHLAHGGGVAGAILHAGGWSIQQESHDWIQQHGPVTHAQPAYTHSGKMPSRYVIHAVGPIWGSGDEDTKLSRAIRGSLRRAEELGCRSIAFPAISTGIFGFPRPRAAQIFFETFKAYFAEAENSQVELVRMTLWDEETVKVFIQEGQRCFPPPTTPA